MIKITDLRKKEQEEENLPELPFFTFDEEDTLRLYCFNDVEEVICINMDVGEMSPLSFDTVFEAMSAFDLTEKIVDVEVVVKNRK